MEERQMTVTWRGNGKSNYLVGETGEIVPNPVFTHPWFESRTYSTFRETSSDPEWRSKVRRHESATGPYFVDTFRYQTSSGAVEHLRYVFSGLFELIKSQGNYVVLHDHPNPKAKTTDSTFESRAYLKWVKKANKELRTMQSGVSLGELRETIHAIRHPLESLKNGIKDYLQAVPSRAKDQLRGTRRQSRGRKAKAISQAISGTYLEYANGWKPFVNDIDLAARTLAEHFSSPGVSYRKITATEQAKESEFSLYSDWVAYGLAIDCNRSDHYENSYRITGEVKVAHTGSSQELLQASGFTLKEFVPTMWELIPLSYVADYFGNMGDILESFAFCHGNRTWWSHTNRARRKTEIRGKVDYSIPQADGYPFYGRALYARGNPGWCKYEHTALTRTNPLTITPSLEFRLPGSHLLSRLANVSSLGVQAFTSSRLLNRLLHG